MFRNVRELENVVHRVDVMVDGGVLEATDVLPLLPTVGTPLTDGRALERALAANGWDVTRTARALGLSRTTLYKLMRRHGVPTKASAANSKGGLRRF